MTCRNSDKARVSSLLVSFVFLIAVLTASAAQGPGATSCTVALASLPGSSSVLGQSVTFTATVTGSVVTPTGEVDFVDGSTLIGSAQLNASATGVFSTAILPAGSHSITAKYDGDSTFAVASSSALPFTVNARLANLVITASPNSVGVGAAAIITAVVTDAAVTGPAGPPGSFLLSGSAVNLNLQSNRSHHAAGLLSNGQVLITGGTVSAAASSTVEVYDPANGHFAAITLDLSTARSGHTATLLADGATTLIAGGEASGKAELYSYDLVTGTGSSAVTGALQNNRSGHTATLLPNGQVLIIGGTVAGTPVDTLEVYTPATGKFVNVASGTLFAPRSGHAVTLVAFNLLSNQATLLITGGDAVGTAELITYSVVAHTVNQVGHALWASSRSDHTATLLPNGKTIMIAGGTSAGSPVTAVELYQIPIDLTVFMTFPTVASPTSLKVALAGQTATLMNNDFVLFTGGEADATKSAELYRPSYDPQGTLGFVSSDLSDIVVSPTGCGLLLGNDGTGNCAVLLTPISLGSLRTITGTYISDGDHTSSTTPASLIVVKGTQATVVVSAPLSAAYGLGLSVLATGGNGTGTYSYDAGTSTACSVIAASGAITVTHGTGTCSITATRAGDADWNVSAVSAPASITVTPAPLTITADSVSKAYGAPLPTLTVSYSGLVNGDTSASLTTQPTPSTTATGISAAGTYLITASGAVDPDYTITYVAGTATVTAVSLTITANNVSKAYGAALPTLTATYSGLVNSDTSASLTTPPTVSTTATATSAAGTYPITASGAVDLNYSITYVAGTATVTAVPLTITANNGSKVYGTALPTLTASYSGFVNGDTSASLTAQPTVSTTATATSVVGNYPITASGAVGRNYTITYADGTLTITTASAAVTPNTSTKLYGAADPAFTGTLNGFLGSDNITSAYSRLAGDTVKDGPYTISAALSPAGVLTNYSITYNTANFTITPATPVIPWVTPGSIVYGTALGTTQLDAVPPTFTYLGNPGPVSGTFTAYTLGTNTSVSLLPASGQSAVGKVLDAGSGEQLQVTFNPTNTLDFNPASKTVAINVSQATPVVTWAAPANIVYGATISRTQLDAAFNWTVANQLQTVAGTPTYTLASGASIKGVSATGLLANTQVLDAGTNQGLLVSFTPTPTNPQNYTAAARDNSITVTKASTSSYVTVVVVPTASGLTYKLQARVSSPDAVPVCAYNTCPPPTGSVSLSDGSKTLLANIALKSGTQVSLDSYASYAPTGTAVSLTATASGAAPLAHSISASYDGKDTNGVQGNYQATVAANQYATQILVAAATPVVSGSLTTTTFIVPLPNWGSAIAVDSNVALVCEVFDITGNIAPTIPCTLNSQATSSSASLSAPTGTTVTVTISPKNSTTAGLRRFSPVFAIMGLPGLGLLVVGFRRRKVLARLGLMLVVLAVLCFMGCGGGFHNTTVPISTGAGTVPGTYFAVVNGTYSVTSTVNGTKTAGASPTTAILAVPVQVQ